MNPVQILVILWRRRVSASLAFLAIAAGALAVLLFATPRFQASSLLVVDDSSITSGDISKSRAIEEHILSIVSIASTEDVLRRAIEQVGLSRIAPKNTFTASKTGINSENDRKDPNIVFETVTSNVRRSLFVQSLPKTNLISVQFSNADPVLAADLVNAVVASIIDKQIELLRHPGAVDFYESQRARFEADVKAAASTLAEFVSAQSIYSASQQQDLLLRRQSDLESSLSATKGRIAERNAQRAALSEQLTNIKPSSSSSLEANFLKMLGGVARQEVGQEKSNTPAVAETLPLAVERVYRDGVASLANINSELSGLQALLLRQNQELLEIHKSLAHLTMNTADFNRLEKAVETATSNAETFERRALNEHIDRDLANARISNLQVAQAATVPNKPTFPNVRVLAPAGLVGGICAAVVAALCAEYLSVRLGKGWGRASMIVAEVSKDRVSMEPVGLESSGS